jgi:hypothetical protein
MRFTYTERYGEQPISQWIMKKTKRFVKEKYGLEIRISINPKYDKEQMK